MKMPFDLDKHFDGRIDDFKNLVDKVWLKILVGTIVLYTMTVHNVLNVIMIQYEKFGGDPMKRSINNQLIAQIGYSIFLENVLSIPILGWRIIFTRLD